MGRPQKLSDRQWQVYSLVHDVDAELPGGKWFTQMMLTEKGVIASPQIEEKADTGGRPGTEYRVGKRDSYVIVAQLSPEFTARWLTAVAGLVSPKAKHRTLHGTGRRMDPGRNSRAVLRELNLREETSR